MCTCSAALTPVITAEDPWDTNNSEKSSKKKDLMMKRCLCVPVPARVTSKDAEADGPSCMCIRHGLQSQVASKLVCWGLALVYKPSPPFRNSVTHSHSTALEDFFFKKRKKRKKESWKERKINCPRMSLPLFVLTVFCACIIPHSHSKSEAYVGFVHAKAGQKSI